MPHKAWIFAEELTTEELSGRHLSPSPFSAPIAIWAQESMLFEPWFIFVQSGVWSIGRWSEGENL